MKVYGHTVRIEAPAEVVFAAVADLARHGDWSDKPLRIGPAASGPVEVGSTFRAVGHQWGRDFPLELRVTSLEAPRRFAFTATGPGEHYVHEFVLHQYGGGTIVERRFTMLRTPLVFRLAMPVIMRTVARRSTLRTLRSLKDRLEGTSASILAR